MPSQLVTVDALDALRVDDVIVDCRFSLADPAAGHRAYETGHIPRAVYADLEHDLSGPVVRGKTGRHPLPEPRSLAERLGCWGIGKTSRVVAYDDSTGAIAARLWWLLRWLGHDDAAVLDGGITAWQRAGRPLTPHIPARAAKIFRWALRPELVADATQVEHARNSADWRVLDARSAERFLGRNETIDPVAGHIPGARSLPFAQNVEGGRMLPPERLRARLEAVLEGTAPERTIAYCGSGVTACHDILAAEIAGLHGMRLYAGSWSEWITDSQRPIACNE